MKILASDVSQSLNDLAFLLSLGNGAINFGISYTMARAMHPAFSICLVIFLIWSDRLRVENPSLMFSFICSMGAIGGLLLGLKNKA